MAASYNTRKRAFDGLIKAPPAPAFTSTSASASTSAEYLPYDVFISHHGGDVKHTLASAIYKSLDATGLRVFLDNRELKLGDFFPEALEQAMANASLHIAIFSKNYAQSAWCLDELEFMLQTRITFIPVFYHVEPSDLRWAIEGKGSYADAFSNHEIKNRYSSEQLQRWKLALHKASLYTGETINNQSDEQKGVKNVVDRVLKELKKDRLDVAKHPVGLDEAVQDFEKIALQSAGPIQIVGIWGMGGAGKTTLAKELYNKKCSTTHRSSFLFDLRETARKDQLHEKQKKLLEDLSLTGAAFDNVDQGKEILKSRLRSATVFIVLDDVDHTDQLDALLPARESLGQGSLIIVTTRELRVLKAWGISAIYKIRTLNAAHAQQLFCWHAFGQPSPLLGFKDLSENFIYACHGLPLSLKVLGGQLYGESSKNYWQSELDKFSRIMPDDIKLSLKISYDALDKEEKEMFLDIACFFIGERSSRAIAVWDGSEWNGMHGWQRLVNKCLVELEWDRYQEYKLIRMHDHLRDLGREIANKQSPYRLWSPLQKIEIHPQQEAIRIRGIVNAIGDNCYRRQGKIIIHTSQGERSLAPSSLGLKIFVGDGEFIDEEYSELSSELVWFQCDEFEHENIPSWLSLKKLRILQLDDPSRLEYLWECDADASLPLRELDIWRGDKLKKIECLKSLRSLETLKIEDCPELDGLPSLAELTSVKKFELIKCYKLEKIESLDSLRSLETLRIVACLELDTLPSLSELIFLEEIELESCKKLKKIESFRSLRSLETLKIYNCPELDGLPSLAELTSVKKFELIMCPKLEKVEGLDSLRSLDTLRIFGCSELDTLPSLAELTFLKEIELENCRKLKKIESLKSLRSLEMLKIKYCPKLDRLPSLAELTFLKEIELKNCRKLKKIESLKSLRSLETLKIKNCPELDGLPSLAELTSVKKFELIECHKLEKLECLDSLRSLETLRIVACLELDTLPSLAELTFLKKIELVNCQELKKIESFKSLRSLETLKIDDCPKLDGLPSLAELTSVKTFELIKCYKLENIEGLDNLRSLETLRIVACPELDNLPSLAELTFLKKIELVNCQELKKIESFKSLRSLETLKIDDCPELDGLPSLAELSSVKTFELIKCYKLENIEGLDNLRSMETLRIVACPELDTLPSLAELTFLKKIELVNCQELKIESFKSLRSLETLKIDDCPELDGLPSLAELSSVKTFELIKCYKLENIEGLDNLRSLETLRIVACPELDTLPSLAELTFLKEIELENCEKLKKIESLKSLRSLETLKIEDCPEIDGLPSLAELTSVKKFELIECHKLEKIESLDSLRSLETLRIVACQELDTLPSLAELTFLKTIELQNCKKLKKIENFKSLRSLETLKIGDCPELDGLPSIAELTSLKEIKLEGCNKLKIEVLEGLISLEELEVRAFLEAQYSVSLKHDGSLKSLEIVGKDVSVVQPFIRNLQQWPGQLIICTRAVVDVGSLKNYFTSFPLKKVVENGLFGGLKLSRPECSANANAILISFIIDDVYPNLLFQIYTDRGNHFYTELTNGKWLWMGVFPQGSDWLQSNRYEIWASSEDKDVKVKEAWLVMGEERSILEAFRQLSQTIPFYTTTSSTVQ